eukprot:CAMPEP_0182552752 /NCGR_PEP_ID=MMETSP1323-20130603/49136_1 /TAXON_ID=236787 /ORGANISM="Florenciella parvula, Strain RCC1693" /LENGTH=101 /DNA_ID=CAMNT_0024764463 /DNA_START=403 /DNA_END=710 /DNA_ORIENTATION=-
MSVVAIAGGFDDGGARAAASRVPARADVIDEGCNWAARHSPIFLTMSFPDPPCRHEAAEAPQPTPRGGKIDAGASESIGGSVGARRGAVALPVDVWDCAAV